MPFYTPSYVAKLPCNPPDSIPIHEFLFGEGDKYGRFSLASSRSPFTCGITGKTYSAVEVAERIECLARALASELRLQVNSGNELEKVIGVFTVNAVDTMTVSWATHRLSGVSAPISPSYSEPELTRQLKAVSARALFTCVPLLPIALESAEAAGIPRNHVYLLDVPEKILKGATAPTDLKTVDQLVEEGRRLEVLPSLNWSEGQGARQIAFLCSSSGTSGLPKNVKISHRNIIANVLQTATYESNYRKPAAMGNLGVLPMSHSYALMVTGHLGVYRGHEVVVLPGFDIYDVLQAIEKNHLEILWMNNQVPPMIVGILKAAAISQKYDLTCVGTVVVGACNLTKEVTDQFSKLLPGCYFTQGYGLTDTAVAASMQNRTDIMFGSCGSLFPQFEARLLDNNGADIAAHDTPGELLLRSPTVMLGYLDNEEATKDSFTDDGWLRTGDLMEIRKSENGYEHLFIVDRVKELIKVRGIQVSPVEVESLLLQHPAVADVTVVPIPNDSAGELPIAFVVRSPAGKEEDENVVRDKIHEFVNGELADYKRLAGGIEFLDALPKSASGKTKRGEMKARAKAILQASRARAAPTVIQSFEFDSDDSDSDDDD
ncbi:putative 4-coumarate--CoA ligase 1 [Tolypocladium ophioglossoides CBS 100239]|uniref:Putative 4-coumarate--CoA ligase 1 n=1 Tax=Tolypocladium ophioglossoides (strain CBS 100239) TaxID=1163406 RepID=A0A0L0NDV4_TOLOC|nr:putative 4-coumarate--CoA ligase 1 [Tolypocladium ophioglossoides CBS 100239]